MKHPKGFNVIVLRPGNRGRRNRKLCLTRQQVRVKRKPHNTHLSTQPRSL